MRTKSIIKIFFLLIVPLIVTSCSRGEEPHYSMQEFHMGTIITEKVYGENAEKAAREAMDKIVGIEGLMSLDAEGSEIKKLNDNSGKSWVELSPETIYVLEKSKEFSDLSGGTFDITVGPLVKAWGISTDNQRIPGDDELKNLVSLTDYNDLLIDKSSNRAMLKREGQMVDLGGIAKGYAADCAIEIYKKHGIKSAIINLGGNVKVLGSKPDGTPWKIGIQNPRAPIGKIVGIVEVTDKTVVSSGDYQRYFIEDSVRYHHIIDPRTGRPADSGLMGVTVITDSSIDADALSTAAFVLGLEKGMELVESLDGVEAVFIDVDKKIYVTDGLKGKFIFEDESKEYEYVEER